MASTAPLVGAGVNHAVRRCDATGNGPDVDDAGAFVEVLDGTAIWGKLRTFLVVATVSSSR